jgi:hypothetical protein
MGHIIISGLFILSMTGLTVNLHYCGEDLYDIALNAPADNCCDEEAHVHQCHPPEDNGHSNHCDDERLKVETTDVFIPSSFSVESSNIHIIDLFTETAYSTSFEGSGDPTSGRLLHFKKPPIPSEVILSQIQSFLI